MKDLKEYIAINEGLIWSYDPEFIINEVKKKFNLNDDIIYFGSSIDEYDKIDYNYNNQKQDTRINVDTNGDYDKNILDKFFNTLGWYYSNKDEDKDKDKYVYVYYPKFQNDVNNKVHNENKYLYHYTRRKLKDKILKQGLIPRSNTNEKSTAHYRGRVHLLKDKINNFDDDKKSEILKMFRGFFPLIEIKIDISNLDIDFYIDPNSKKYSYITYDNIHPKYIKEIKDYEI